MSKEIALKHLEKFGLEDRAMFFDVSSATVSLAAKAVGVEDAKICKTLSFYNKDHDGCIIIQAAGDAKINNGMFKRLFGYKPRMLSLEDIEKFTNHEIGGVCAFGITNPNTKVYCDESMKRFDYVYPACGCSSSAVKLTPDELFDVSGSIDWVKVSKY